MTKILPISIKGSLMSFIEGGGVCCRVCTHWIPNDGGGKLKCDVEDGYGCWTHNILPDDMKYDCKMCYKNLHPCPVKSYNPDIVVFI